MRVRKSLEFETVASPQTRSELQQWVRDRMHLPAGQEQALLDAIDNVFMKHERLWQQSKQEAIQAVSAGFTDRLNRLRDERNPRRPDQRLRQCVSPLHTHGAGRPWSGVVHAAG